MKALKSIQNAHLTKFAKSNNVHGAMIALKLGADVNARGKDGWTPVMHAYSHYNSKMVEFLKSKGAHMTAEDKLNAQIAATLHKTCNMHETHTKSPHENLGLTKA